MSTNRLSSGFHYGFMVENVNTEMLRNLEIQNYGSNILLRNQRSMHTLRSLISNVGRLTRDLYADDADPQFIFKGRRKDVFIPSRGCGFQNASSSISSGDTMPGFKSLSMGHRHLLVSNTESSKRVLKKFGRNPVGGLTSIYGISSVLDVCSSTRHSNILVRRNIMKSLSMEGGVKGMGPSWVNLPPIQRYVERRKDPILIVSNPPLNINHILGGIFMLGSLKLSGDAYYFMVLERAVSKTLLLQGLNSWPNIQTVGPMVHAICEMLKDLLHSSDDIVSSCSDAIPEVLMDAPESLPPDSINDPSSSTQSTSKNSEKSLYTYAFCRYELLNGCFNSSSFDGKNRNMMNGGKKDINIVYNRDCSTLERLSSEIGYVYDMQPDLFHPLDRYDVRLIQKRVLEGSSRLSPIRLKLIPLIYPKDQSHHVLYCKDFPMKILSVTSEVKHFIVLTTLARVLVQVIHLNDIGYQNSYGFQMKPKDFYSHLMSRDPVESLYRIDLTLSLKTIEKDYLLQRLEYIIGNKPVFDYVKSFLS